MSQCNDVPNASHVTEYQVSDSTASQYWRELCRGLRQYLPFAAVNRPMDILTTINDLVSEVESVKRKHSMYVQSLEDKEIQLEKKDREIATLVKRNESLTDILSHQLSKRPSIGASESSESSVHARQLENETKVYAPSENVPVIDAKENGDIGTKYQLVDRDTLYGHWKTVSNERDTIKRRNEALQSEVAQLQQKMESLRTQSTHGNNIITHELRGDKELILKRDDDGKCGIKFRSESKIPLLTESNTVVANLKAGLYNSADIGIGDFVIEVNGCNVQHLPLDDVLEMVKGSEELKLKVRSPKASKKTLKNISGQSSEWGVVLAVYVKSVKYGSYGYSKGIREMDELIKVNSRDTNELVLKKIYNSMNKEIKLLLGHKRNPYLFNDSSNSGTPIETRKCSTGNHSNPPPTLPPGNYRPPIHGDNGSSSPSDSYSNPPNLPDLAGQFSGGSDSFNSSKSSGDNMDGDILTTCLVQKNDYEAFGWCFIGGNKVGIYIQSIDNWSPVEKAGIEVGWKLISIDGTSLVNVAYCFALDYLASLRQKTTVSVKLSPVPSEVFRGDVSRRPYDNFYIKALIDYKKKTGEESSFKANEVFCVGNSCYVTEGKSLKWEANNSLGLSVILPSQKAKFILNGNDSSINNRRSKDIPVRYYEILDEVDIEIKNEVEMEGAF